MSTEKVVAVAFDDLCPSCQSGIENADRTGTAFVLCEACSKVEPVARGAAECKAFADSLAKGEQ